MASRDSNRLRNDGPCPRRHQRTDHEILEPTWVPRQKNSSRTRPPNDSTDHDPTAGRDFAISTILRGQPTALVRAAIRSWNAAVKEVSGWPQHQLTLPEIKRDGYALPTQSFSATFQKSLSEYIAFLADPPEDDDAPLRGLRPTTLILGEFQFRQMASALRRRPGRGDHPRP
jgi:hypothetical protein